MYISIQTLDLVMVEAPLVAIIALSLLGNDATSLANLNMEYFSHSSLQILESSVRLDWERRCTVIFSSFHWFSMGFKSGLWLGHSMSFIELFSNHSFVIVAVCLGTDLCGTVNHRQSWRSWGLWSSFSSRMSLYNDDSSSPLSWQDPHFLPLKYTPITWCSHHHASPWGWLFAR